MDKFRAQGLRISLNILKDMRGRNTLKKIFNFFFDEMFRILEMNVDKMVLYELLPMLFEFFEIEKESENYWERLKELLNSGGFRYKM